MANFRGGEELLMIVLGVTDGDDSGSCIAKDGVLLAAVSEERLNRKKTGYRVPVALDPRGASAQRSCAL